MAQSLLATDGYKFSMAEAGWPLRTETFYYSHRKGGPQVLPVDVPAFLRSLLPTPADDEYRYLVEHSYELGPGFKAAIVQTDALQIHALPRGAVFYEREPVFTVTGPSALVSWLEPQVLMLHYRIQVASHAGEVRVVTCERQRHRPRDARRGRPSRARDRGRFRRLLPPGPRRSEGPGRGRQDAVLDTPATAAQD
jgi:nicotinic acid phosphoribosyltransferase